MTTRGRDLASLGVVALAGLIVGEGVMFLRPDLTRTGGFLFGDQGHNLFLTAEVLRGARLYQDVAYVYGWLPVFVFAAFAAVFGNTPAVYLHFLLCASIVNLMLAYAVLRRVLRPGGAAFVTVVGLLPVFLVPGSLLGGYMSSFYLPLERTALLLVALVWQPPARRSIACAAWMGVLTAALQMIKFGPGLVLLAVLVALDAALIAADPAGRLSRWVRLAATTAGVAAAGEALLAATAFALLPQPVAWDVIWPEYLVQSYPPAVSRWPGWSGWRLLVAQYFNPLAGIVLTGMGAFAVWRQRGRAAADEAVRVLIFPLLFTAGAFTFFRTDHHFRQFAWTFALGSAIALARYPWCRALALAGWLPVAAVVGLSVVRSPDPRLAEVITPSGWRLTVTPDEKRRIESIDAALATVRAREGGGPALFYPAGAGFHLAYAVPHVSRHAWFFQAAIRPYEAPALAAQYGSLAALVACRDEGNTTPFAGSYFHEDVPREIRDAIESRIAGTVWRDERCAVFRLAGRGGR